MSTFRKSFYLAALLLLAGFVSAPLSLADSLSSPGNSVFDPAADAPAADLGWFYNGDSEFLFPASSDPSSPWTSAANLATISAWESLIAATQGDPGLLAELIGMGMNGMSASEMAGLQLAVAAQSGATGSSLSSEGSATPEPSLLGLVGGGGVILGLFAFARLRAAGDSAMAIIDQHVSL